MKYKQATLPFTVDAFNAITTDNTTHGQGNTDFFAFVYAPKSEVTNAFPPVGGFGSNTLFWPPSVSMLYFIRYNEDIEQSLASKDVEGFTPVTEAFFETHQQI